MISKCPIIAEMVLYNDILNYRSGIYVPNKSSSILASPYYMLIVGFDKVNDVGYYICKFSFGT
jgi:hypothetical protein